MCRLGWSWCYFQCIYSIYLAIQYHSLLKYHWSVMAKYLISLLAFRGLVCHIPRMQLHFAEKKVWVIRYFYCPDFFEFNDDTNQSHSSTDGPWPDERTSYNHLSLLSENCLFFQRLVPFNLVASCWHYWAYNRAFYSDNLLVFGMAKAVTVFLLSTLPTTNWPNRKKTFSSSESLIYNSNQSPKLLVTLSGCYRSICSLNHT